MKIGAQMYTVRDFCKTAEDGVKSLEKLAAMGYKQVQYSGCDAIPPALMRETCDRLGMTIPFSHSPYNRIIGDTEALIEDHRVMGCDCIGLGFIGEAHRNTMACLERFYNEMREPIKKIREAGMTFAYHNHSFEFAKVEGKMIFDHLLEMFPPEEMSIVMDTYWIQHGGGDIYQWIDKCAGRLKYVHLKDMGMTLEMHQKMTPIGEGSLNFPTILKAFEEAGSVAAFVEQDNCNDEDPFDCMEHSLRYLQSIGYEA